MTLSILITCKRNSLKNNVTGHFATVLTKASTLCTHFGGKKRISEPSTDITTALYNNIYLPVQIFNFNYKKKLIMKQTVAYLTIYNIILRRKLHYISNY